MTMICAVIRLKSARLRSHPSWPRRVPASGSTSILKATARPSSPMPARWGTKASCPSSGTRPTVPARAERAIAKTIYLLRPRRAPKRCSVGGRLSGIPQWNLVACHAVSRRLERLCPTEWLAPVAPTGADDDDEQPERQIDGDDLADAVEAGASTRPVLGVNSPFEREPRSVEQPDEECDHQPADHLHQVDVQTGTGKATEDREHHPIATGEQQQNCYPNPGKEFLEGDPHQSQALRRLERAERRSQAGINREHAANPDDRTEYV